MSDTPVSARPPHRPAHTPDPQDNPLPPVAVDDAPASRGRSQPAPLGDAGQATAEYALVLLGAAAVALLLIGWATTTDQISRLFDFVIEQVIGRSG